MAPEAISRELIDFLRDCISSIRQLEVLLWLHARPGQAWSAIDISRELRGNPAATARWLEGFRGCGLVSTNPGEAPTYRYAPARAELDAIVGELAREYKIRPLKVIDAIVNRPAMKMMSFMDAFRIKPEGNDDAS